MKFIHIYHFSLSLISGITLLICSNCSSNNSSSSRKSQQTPNTQTEIIAENGRTVEQNASVQEILVQFHGCKAHQ